MTNTQKLIELVIEDLKKPKWYLPEEVEVFLEERFQEVAQSARNERDAEWKERLKEVLPVVRGDMLCKCNPEDIDAALVHIEELILSPNPKE